MPRETDPAETTAEEDEATTEDAFAETYGKPPDESSADAGTDDELTPDEQAAKEKADAEAADELTAEEQAAKDKTEADAAAAAGEKTDEEKEADRLIEEQAAADAAHQEAVQYWEDVASIHPDVDLTALKNEDSPLGKRAREWVGKQDTATQALVAVDGSAIGMARALTLMKADGVFDEPAPAKDTTGVLDFLAEQGIADHQITTSVDGEETTLTLKELATQYPDIFESQYAMLRAMSTASDKRIRELLDKRLEDAGYVKQNDISDLRKDANEARITKEHSDYGTIKTNAKFIAYKETLPTPIQALWDGGTSDGRNAVLKLYKQAVAKDIGADAKEKRGAAHKRKAGLHADTLRGDGAERPGSPEPQDEKEAFDATYGKPAA